MKCLSCKKELLVEYYDDKALPLVTKGSLVKIEPGYGSDHDMARHAPEVFELEEDHELYPLFRLMQSHEIRGVICDECVKNHLDDLMGFNLNTQHTKVC